MRIAQLAIRKNIKSKVIPIARGRWWRERNLG
jgi:hypothetical protein